MEQFHDTREGWLSHGLTIVAPRFKAVGYPLPADIKVACGFAPGARGGKALGVCISPKASAGGTTEMFVSPTVSDALTALGVLVHEAAHGAAGVENGHGPKFKAVCAAIGLEGKATQAMPGASLNEWLRSEVLPLLGAYPHSAVDPNARKKQGTRMIKLVCPETGYTVRTTKKWLEQGLPVSPAGCEMQVVADEGEE